MAYSSYPFFAPQGNSPASYDSYLATQNQQQQSLNFQSAQHSSPSLYFIAHSGFPAANLYVGGILHQVESLNSNAWSAHQSLNIQHAQPQGFHQAHNTPQPAYQQPPPPTSYQQSHWHTEYQPPSAQPAYQQNPYQPPTQVPQNQQLTYAGHTYYQYIPDESMPEEPTPEDWPEESILERDESEQHTLQHPPATVLSDQARSSSNNPSTSPRRRPRRRRGRNTQSSSF
ncbi:hypothetical protein IQ07DRAFT_601892 [Pyrenochaeta sp. DS3sAY3a]|nr:hypothetical protein IQ07DRAFT_601892 [Pyrenochaeta sp. DS3sAY3a]